MSGPLFSRATVAANDDPKRAGRVRLRYPWLSEESSSTASEWARVCFPGASSAGGFWLLPEVGDEVLVYFESGDLNSPLVVGTLYNAKHPAPQSGLAGDGNADGENSVRFFKSKSGHLLAFDDSPGGAAVTLKNAADHKICLKKDSVEIESGSTKLLLKGGKIVIQAAQAIELGEGASEALLKGTTFVNLFNAHTHATGVGPSGPPTPPLDPSVLSQKVKTT